MFKPGTIMVTHNIIPMDEFFFQAILVKAKVMDKLFLDLNINRYKNVFFYLIIYKYIVFVLFIIICANTFQAYREAFKNKDYLTLSSFNS
jgi:hypothetical protein